MLFLYVILLFATSNSELVSSKVNNDMIIGSTAVFLDNDNKKCQNEECNIANFINDAMVEEWVNMKENGSWSYTTIAVSNAGSFQASIDEHLRDGNITYGDLLLVQPFNNTFDTVELTGSVLKEVLELSATKVGTSGLMQWSGLRVTLDLSRPVNQRAVDITVRCRQCRVPVYEPLDLQKTYRVVMHSYLIEHADDGYNVITDNYKNRRIGRQDMEVVVDYLKRKSPVVHGVDGRLSIIN